MELGVFENSIKFLSGDKAVCNLTYELSQYGCVRPMVICDELAYRLGPYDYVRTALNELDINIIKTFYKVDNIATSEICEKIVSLYKEAKCDCIIAIGKKGAIATAKGAKILLCEDVHRISHYDNVSISDYIVREVPLFVIPTHLGTGIESANFVRVLSKKTNKMYEFDTTYAASDAVIIDQKMTDILPPKAIVSHTLYALAMAMECFRTTEEVPFVCKAYADAAIRLLKEYAEKCLLRNANKEYRTKVLEAVVYAGAGFALLSRGELAILSDIISDRYQVNYPNVFAVLFRQYIKIKEHDKLFGYALSALVDESEYALYAKEMRLPKLLNEIEEFYIRAEKYVVYNNKLSSFNIKEEDLDLIVEQYISIAGEQAFEEKDRILELLKMAF